MRIAITGGTGFIGGNVARALLADGHEVVIVSRSRPRNPLAGADVRAVGLDDPRALAVAFAGCDAVAHCAGINRELGRQTYQRVHVEGTAHVVEAARIAGVRKVLLTSFLRARPGCGSPYHESKYAAEQIVRRSGLDHTIVKPGVVYGRGDHMLDHLSHAFHTFPLFALVGMRDQPVAPLAVRDLVRAMGAALVDGRLSRQTVAVTGPEQITLAAAVRRVMDVVGRHPWTFRMPVAFHYAFAWLCERMMRVPLVSLAQVRILSEGIVEPAGAVDALPPDLAPRLPFTAAQIAAGLPEPGGFSLSDCRCCCRINWRMS